MDADIYEAFKTFLPAYLTPEQKEDLYAELDAFPENTNYFLHGRYHSELFQGDGWDGLYVSNIAAGGGVRVKGLVLSNTCDIAVENAVDRPRKLVFTPLLRLSTYQEFLLQSKGQASVENILYDIRRQRVSYIFYLPAYDQMEEAIAILDDVSSIGLSEFLNGEPNKLFTLTQYGFYIFLLKLSIHFTRFQEGVQRFPVVEDA